MLRRVQNKAGRIPLKFLIGAGLGLVFLAFAAVAGFFIILSSDLPQIVTVADYQPLLTSEIYDRQGKKIGEFKREKRILTAYADIPEVVRNAFIASEDSTFFKHSGINFLAILRAALANLRAGQKVQGASTITQQLARSLLLSNQKTYERKLKEILLAYRMEEHLSKEDILYLYLNQIYLGQGAYGVAAAAQTYFRKDLKDLGVAEAALLAGLPKAPTRYAPKNEPKRAKERQRYVIQQMVDEKYVSRDEGKAAAEQPLVFFVEDEFQQLAPSYVEAVRILLFNKLGGDVVLDQGIKIHTGLDLAQQVEAEKSVRRGLEELDKRQGYRGPLQNISDMAAVTEFLAEVRKEALERSTPQRVLLPDGTIQSLAPEGVTGATPLLPSYLKVGEKVKGVVKAVNDKWGLVTVAIPDGQGLIDVETMGWARKPDPQVNSSFVPPIEKPSKVLKKGDVIFLRIVSASFTSNRLNRRLADLAKEAKRKKRPFERPVDLPVFESYAGLELEQVPEAEAAVVSLDQATGDLTTMVGGYDFERSKFNRAYQAVRQTGSSFKSIVYLSALDKSYTPATQMIDAPIVFEEEGQGEKQDGKGEGDSQTQRWVPMNHSNRFIGELLFRDALIQSLNVPTVAIIEKIGVNWVVDYARRLGIFSPLNMDFTLALGSSSLTLYEMTKLFSTIGRLGRRIRPIIVRKVESASGEVLIENLSFDENFANELMELEQQFEERRLAYLDFLNQPKGYPARETTAASPEAASDSADDWMQGLDPEEVRRRKKVVSEPPLFFNDPDQLIRPQTAYVATTLLQGVLEDPGGTGRAARAIGRPAAGKTGTTNGYFDAWFIGFTPQLATGVWVGYDTEKTLGAGEVGGRAALPIWVEFMREAHQRMPFADFAVPDGIVFANIDGRSGKLASPQTKTVVRQAFIAGTEPVEVEGRGGKEEEQDFLRQDLEE